MKLPWIVALAALGTAAYVLLNKEQFQTTARNTDLESAANKAGIWGTDKRITGTGGSLLGKAKEGIGSLTGDKSLQGEGLVDQVVGTVKDTAGQAAHAVADTLYKANR